MTTDGDVLFFTVEGKKGENNQRKDELKGMTT